MGHEGAPSWPVPKVAPMRLSGVPSIRNRLANALLLWSLLWSLGVALAVGYAAQVEVDELLDESLQSTAAILANALRIVYPEGEPATAAAPMPSSEDAEFAWQLVAANGAIVQRSANAPDLPLRTVARPA